MDELVGPDVDVVLSLKEVTDLSFITAPVFAEAALLENQLQTDLHPPDTIIKFNIDLVWQTNKQNIKKMRNNNIPIKLTLFKQISENQKERFGYIVLNLRTAQFLPRGKHVKISEDYVKVLGLGKEAKGCFPHILLSLRIQDKIEEKSVEPLQKMSNPSVVPEEKIENTRPKIAHEEVVEKQYNFDNVLKYEGGDGKATVDDELISWKVGVQQSPRSPRTKHSLTIGNANDRSASLSSYDRRNSSGDLQPQKKYVQAFHNYKLEILLRSTVWYKVPPKFNFRFHHSRSEIMSTAHPEITIEKSNEEVELCDINSSFVFVETPSEFFKLITTVPPIVSIAGSVMNRPTIIARGILDTTKLNYNGEQTRHSVDLVEVKTHEVWGRLTYTACLTDQGPQVMKDLTLKVKSPTVDENEVPPVFYENVTDKIVDELEEWKERQKDIFQQKFASKLKAEIQELRAEWMERKKELEEKLNEKMEQCRELGNSLITATEDVKQKSRDIMEKEKNLDATKSELEVRYLKLLTDKNEETEKLRMEFRATIKENEERLSRIEEEKMEMEKRVKVLQVENEQLKEVLKATESELERIKKTCLSQEQTSTLLQDLKTMQEKLETANNSKLFFKEQWGRAVREIHRIKSEHTKNIQVQLQYRKDELKKLGLEQVFLNEKNKNNLERDDMLEARDFLGSDFDVRSMSDVDFPYKAKGNYESFKTSMDIVRESNSYLLKNNQEHEERLNRLIEERDKLIGEGFCQIDDERVVKLNKEIRHLLEH